MIRRSSRLMEQTLTGKRGREDVQKSDASNPGQVRARGLFSSPFASPLLSESPFASTTPPVELVLNDGVHTPLQPGFNDENSPPIKRRLLSPADEHIIDNASQNHDALEETEMSVEPPQTGAVATWFTPVRPARPAGWWNSARTQTGSEPSAPEVNNSQETSHLSSMPSFASWIDEDQVEEATPSPCGGIDMTDLAMMYDPETAAKARASMPPPSPIEKLFARRESS